MLKTHAIIILLLLVTLNLCVLTKCAAAAARMKKPSEDLVVSKCRQKCFLKALDNFAFRSRINSIRSLLTCQQNPDCFMCWDYCRLLRVAKTDLAEAMCNDVHFCSKGCRIACDYHRVKFFEIFFNELENNNA